MFANSETEPSLIQLARSSATCCPRRSPVVIHLAARELIVVVGLLLLGADRPGLKFKSGRADYGPTTPVDADGPTKHHATEATTGQAAPGRRLRKASPRDGLGWQQVVGRGPEINTLPAADGGHKSLPRPLMQTFRARAGGGGCCCVSVTKRSPGRVAEGASRRPLSGLEASCRHGGPLDAGRSCAEGPLGPATGPGRGPTN